ncbi:MAG: hypothetical protein K2X86_18155 [Cytophagaceae bacterium]|nr:hypothetical protein [Cytophagaceae bacterium]
MRVEKSYKNEALAISIGFHALLLLILFLFVLKPMDPPLGELGGGVDLNYGEVDAGTGDPNNLNPSDPNSGQENLVPLEVAPEEPTEPTSSETEIPVSDNKDAIPVPVDKPKDDKVKPVDTKTDKTKPVDKPSEPTVDKKTLFPGKNNKPSGDDKNKPGDPGNPLGKDGKKVIGNPGYGDDPNGTGGISFGEGLGGWRFKDNPIPKNLPEERGSIVFYIKVNDDGLIISAKVLQNNGVSVSSAEMCRVSILKMPLERINDGNVPPFSEGPVTVQLKAE